MEKNSFKKLALHTCALAAGAVGAIYLPLDNKELMGWMVTAFTTFGGILLAVMTLAGHSLTLLQTEDWLALEFFKATYKTRIYFSASISFLLIFTVLLIFCHSLFTSAVTQRAAGFLLASA